ncbi:MAG TPA: histidine kinase dimerization/phospho-acceptor domain-containing protein [Sphingomicrobium sp.]|nr:histidine kinase dimerization/phospho-acceptor domain-containing protein [Sphingomicrobium sp.]
MRFDDRLVTVLNQPAADRHDAAVRWRQLVDLVARAGPHSDSMAVDQALEAIRRDGPQVEESLRAAAARAVAALPLPLGLLQYFASDRLTVSAPVIAAATLDRGQWSVLWEAADEETRRFIETLHPEAPPAPPLELTETLGEASEKTAEDVRALVRSPAVPSLHAVVERIERRRRGRGAEASPAHLSPPPGSPALFRWECGAGGEIAWVEGAPRGALIGRSIARATDPEGDRIDERVVRAFAMRSPFREGVITFSGEGPVAGEWKISGVPAFEPVDGRFAGYRGIALRESPPVPAATPAAELLGDPDSLRELVHEIKTPLNAIIGFAEIIEGQYLGPADRRYRERAQEIVAQARLLLEAIDDLDFAAKHRSSGNEAPLTDLGELVESLAPEIREGADARGVSIEGARPLRRIVARIEAELARRLVSRMAAALIDCAAAGERLRIDVGEGGRECRVAISCPAALRHLDEGQMFGTEDAVEGRFRLRLVRGLARIAGATLVGESGAVALLFPSS